MGVNSLPKLLPDSVATAIWTRALLHANRSATEPALKPLMYSNQQL